MIVTTTKHVFRHLHPYFLPDLGSKLQKKMTGHGFHTDGLGLGIWYKSAGPQTATVVVERREIDALTMFIHRDSLFCLL